MFLTRTRSQPLSQPRTPTREVEKPKEKDDNPQPDPVVKPVEKDPSTDTTPQNCKVVNYPAQQQIAGHVCGNTLVADVPLSGFGAPVNGPLLYNVTAVAGGRNADNDLYSDVDLTRSFDYVLGSSTGGSSC